MSVVARASAALAVSVVLASPAAAARPMTIQDLLSAVRVTDPQLSPDGRLVAFVRTTTEIATGQRNADIWVVPSDGSRAPTLLVGGEKSENTPRWAPDGQHIAFISTRSGTPQVFIANLDGSNVRALTTRAEGVQPPLVFSRDGRMLAFVSDVEMQQGIPATAHSLTRLLYRHWDEWRDKARHHIFLTTVDGGEPRDLTPGDFDSPPTQQEDNAFVFTPDGKELVFVSNRDGIDREAWSTNTDIWSVPVGGGQAKPLTSNPAADAQPVFTPDGRFMLVRAQRRPGFESDRWYLDVYDRGEGNHRTVFDAEDLSVTDFTLSRDGRTIFFTATWNGADALYRVPFEGGRPELMTNESEAGSISAPQAGLDFAVVSKSTLTSPAELFRLPFAAKSLQPLTHENDAWLRDVAFAKPERLTVPGAGGVPIQYWVLRPSGFDPTRKYPIVFLLHGGPQGAWDDAWSYRWNPALWAAQGWVIVAPNPRGSFGFGQKFVDEISQDWGGRVMQDLEAVFDAAGRLPYVDATKQGIAGASYGGYAVNWIIGHSNRFTVAVTHDGVFNIESMALATEEQWFTDWEFGGPPSSAKARENYAKWSPHLLAQNIKTPTLVITNELDFRVPVDQGLQLFTALRRNGVPSQALVFSDEGHWVLKPLNSKLWHETVFGWMKKYLGERP
jgi:dipeptidyl aminopeptidase/acylaminoacyl peptidase